jgi:hypothetical protein
MSSDKDDTPNPQQPLADGNIAWLKRNGLMPSDPPEPVGIASESSRRSPGSTVVAELLEQQGTKDPALKEKQGRLLRLLDGGIGQKGDAANDGAGGDH